MKKRISSLALAVVLMLALVIVPMFAFSASAAEDGEWKLVTDASTLKAGDKIVIACNGSTKGSFVAGSISSQVMASVSATFSSDKSTMTSLPSGAAVLTLGGSSGAWTLTNTSGKLLGATAVKKVAFGSGTTTWSISIGANGAATIQNGTSSYGRFLYNVSSPRFTTYTSNTSTSMLLPQIYRFEAAATEPDVPDAPACEHTNTTPEHKDATCTEDGYDRLVCADCQEVVETTPINKLGHEWDEGVVTKEPQKGVEGVKTYTCENDNTHTKTEAIPALGCAVDFVTPDGVEAPEALTDKTSVELPTLDDLAKADGYEYDYVFAGWTTDGEMDDEDTTKPSKFYKGGETVTLTDDTTFTAVYMRTAGGGSSSFTKTDVANIKETDVVVIVYTTGGKTYAVTNNNGTSKAPVTAAVTIDGNVITGDIADNLKWNISYNSGSFTIYVNGDTSKWLYCTNANNGVRVGTNTAKTFFIDGTSGYIKHEGTNRYLGIYNAQDLRCYTSTTTNIANQAVAFYAASTGTTYYCTTPTLNTGCAHTDTTETRVEPNCTDKGSVTVTCNGCGETVSYEELDALGHDWDEGTVTKQSSCTENGVVEYTCQNDCGETYEEVIKAGHNYVDDVCTVCGKVGFEGRYYIAALRGTYWWMTSDLGDAATLRYQAVNSGLTALPGMISFADKATIQVFVLEKNDDGTYKIYADGVNGNKYLGWNGGNSGTLVSEADAINFTVDVDENGLFNIHFADAEGERYLALNGTSSNFFAFYKSGQIQDLALVPVEEPAAVDGTAVELNRDLSMYYFVTLANGFDGTKLTATFTVNGKDQVVEAVLQADGRYLFKCTGIGPHQMGDTIEAKFFYDGALVLEDNDWTVAKNLKALYEDASEELKTLIADTLAYGAAAQTYLGYNEDNLVTDGFEGAVSEALPTEGDNVRDYSEPLYNPTNSETYAYVSAFGVLFDNLNKVYFKVVTNDVENVTVTINGVEVELVAVEGKENVYYAYSAALAPTEYADTLELVIALDGEEVQNATYSLNSYTFAKANDETAMGALATALYRYGKSVVAYADTL